MAFAQPFFEKYWSCWRQNFPPGGRLLLGGVALSSLSGCTGQQQPGVAGQYLHADELHPWSGFRREKRRVEWLGGRLAAKWAAAGFLKRSAADWRNLVIRTEKDGRPYLATKGKAVTPCISISHSGPLAAALAANFPCGLDIQQPRAKIHTVKELFAFPEEETLLHAILPNSFTQTEELSLLWAAKEAVRKMVRIAPLLGFQEIRFAAGQGGQGAPDSPLMLTCSSGRRQEGCPPIISVLCFFADNMAWAIAFPSAIPTEQPVFKPLRQQIPPLSPSRDSG